MWQEVAEVCVLRDFRKFITVKQVHEALNSSVLALFYLRISVFL